MDVLLIIPLLSGMVSHLVDVCVIHHGSVSLTQLLYDTLPLVNILSVKDNLYARHDNWAIVKKESVCTVGFKSLDVAFYFSFKVWKMEVVDLFCSFVCIHLVLYIFIGA